MPEPSDDDLSGPREATFVCRVPSIAISVSLSLTNCARRSAI